MANCAFFTSPSLTNIGFDEAEKSFGKFRTLRQEEKKNHKSQVKLSRFDHGPFLTMYKELSSVKILHLYTSLGTSSLLIFPPIKVGSKQISCLLLVKLDQA